MLPSSAPTYSGIMAAAAEPAWTSLAGFQIDRVLMNDGSTVAVLGRDAHDAVEVGAKASALPEAPGMLTRVVRPRPRGGGRNGVRRRSWW